MTAPVEQMSWRVRGAPTGLVDEVWGDCYRAVPHFRGGLVVDVGAGVGTFSMFAADHGCRVEAYEPHEPSYARLCENVAGLPVAARQLPVGDGSTVGMREAGHGVQTYTGSGMATVTLGEVVAGRPVDVLKVDCEGAEYPLLLGADLSLVRYLAVEVHVWTDTPNDVGLGVRADPMPTGAPEKLIAWVSRTHRVTLSDPRVPAAGGYLFAES